MPEQAGHFLRVLVSSAAEVDANFVITSGGGLVEVQATGEQGPFSRAHLDKMLRIAEVACDRLFLIQRDALGLSRDSIDT